MAKGKKGGEDKDTSGLVRRKKKDEPEEKLEDKFAPLKVAHTVQHQIKDFKVCRKSLYCYGYIEHFCIKKSDY